MPSKTSRTTWLVLAVACGLAGGCDTEPSEAGRLRLDIEPLLDEHARFDRWARRVGVGESAFRSREALSETAFAPLRDRSRVVAAWIQRDGPDATELRHPDGAPALPEDGWVTVRVPDHELEEVDARRATLTIAGEAQDLMLIRRSRPAPGGATLHVTVGF